MRRPRCSSPSSVRLWACSCVLLVTVAGCATPSRSVVISPPPPPDFLTRLTTHEQGILEGWAWSYSVRPAPGARVPRGVDAPALALDLHRVNDLMGDTRVTAVGVPVPAELLLIAESRRDDRRTWLDPYQLYGCDADGSELHRFVRYETTYRGRLLRRESVYRVGRAGAVRETITQDDLVDRQTKLDTRELTGATVHTLPEGEFTPWRFGMTFGPTSPYPRPVSQALHAWTLETTNPVSTAPADGRSAVRLAAHRASAAGPGVWRGSLVLLQGGGEADCMPIALEWRTSRHAWERIFIDARWPALDGATGPLVPRLVRRTVARPDGPFTGGRTLRYELGSFVTIGDAPLRLSEVESLYQSVDTMNGMEGWGFGSVSYPRLKR